MINIANIKQKATVLQPQTNPRYCTIGRPLISYPKPPQTQCSGHQTTGLPKIWVQKGIPATWVEDSPIKEVRSKTPGLMRSDLLYLYCLYQLCPTVSPASWETVVSSVAREDQLITYETFSNSVCKFQKVLCNFYSHFFEKQDNIISSA